MAKVTSLITLKGTVGNITFVKSPTYGDHIRAKRGTHKKARMNAAWRKQSKDLMKINRLAKVIKDAIDPYRQELRDGRMWPRLISAIQAQGDPASFDFSRLRPFEIHDRYRMDRFFDLKTNTKVDRKRSLLHVNTWLNSRPNFKDTPFVDGYRIGVIGIFPDQKNKGAWTEAACSEIMPLTRPTSPIGIEIPFPPRSKTFLICLSVEGCAKGKVDETMPSKAMRIVEAGRI